MAFTFSHPAAILPLRKYLPFSALVIASMAPDFLYFIPGVHHRHYGHSTQGTFTFSIPITFVVLWLFHSLMKRPLLRLVPYWHQQRLVRYMDSFSFGAPKQWLLLLFTIFIGVETHIWWDACTHEFGYFPKHFPILNTPLNSTGTLLVSGALQDGTSLIGALVLLDVYLRWARRATPVPVPRYYRISGSTRLAVGVIIASLSVAAAILMPTPIPPWKNTVYHIVTSEVLDMTRAFMLLVLLLCVLWMPRSNHAVET